MTTNKSDGWEETEARLIRTLAASEVRDRLLVASTALPMRFYASYLRWLDQLW